MDFFLAQKNWLLAIPRTPFWDCFFKLCVFFDTEYFIFVVIPFIWFALDPKKGLRLLYILLLSALVNIVSKNLFQLPRPCSLDPGICLIRPPLSYGFPSGAAQTAMLLGLLLFSYTRNIGVRVFSFFYILLVSFSRLYLNVHFPIDILGGWILGIFLFLFYKRAFPILEIFFQKQSPLSRLRWGIFIPLIIEFLYPDVRILYVMHSAMGVALGLFLFQKTAKKVRPKLYKGALAVVTLFFWVFFLKIFTPLSASFSAFLLGCWISVGFPYFFEPSRG